MRVCQEAAQSRLGTREMPQLLFSVMQAGGYGVPQMSLCPLPSLKSAPSQPLWLPQRVSKGRGEERVERHPMACYCASLEAWVMLCLRAQLAEGSWNFCPQGDSSYPIHPHPAWGCGGLSSLGPGWETSDGGVCCQSLELPDGIRSYCCLWSWLKTAPQTG